LPGQLQRIWLPGKLISYIKNPLLCHQIGYLSRCHIGNYELYSLLVLWRQRTLLPSHIALTISNYKKKQPYRFILHMQCSKNIGSFFTCSTTCFLLWPIEISQTFKRLECRPHHSSGMHFVFFFALSENSFECSLESGVPVLLPIELNV
jgi:hypothetical protein